MTAKPKIGLLDDWRRVLRRAWSIRFSLLALAALGVTPAGFGWIKGASHVRAQWDAAIQQQTLQATVKVVTEYVDRVRVVREKGDTIIKEVPVHGPYKPMLLALSTVALCACTTLPPQVECPSPPEMLMRPPQALRSLPSLEPLPPTTKPATKTPSN